uniref:JmjC domain-containing protein n=1 Tax=Romanomermis culicivorax TaxID=13658 RepID=A0A915L5V0_ROMCU
MPTSRYLTTPLHYPPIYLIAAVETMKNPLLLQRGAVQWPIVHWSDGKWSQVFGSKILRFRIGHKKNTVGRIQWENDCVYENATFDQFQDWLRATKNCPENPMATRDPTSHWAYMGYQYMFELFDKDDDTISAIEWDRLGLDKDGWQSTIWIGSQGAYTPCHFDTYGFNLVLQIKGIKFGKILGPWEERGAALERFRLALLHRPYLV